MKTHQSRLTGAVAVMIAQAMVLVLGYVTHLWIGNALGAGPYGVYGVVLNIQSIFGMFLTLGVPVAIARYVAQEEQHAQSILQQGTKLQILIGLFVAGLVLITSPLMAMALGDSSLTPFIAFVAAVIFTQSLYPIYVQFFSGLHRFNKQALLTGIYAVAKLIGALFLIYVFGVFGAFAGFAVGGVVAAALGWHWSRGQGGASLKKLPTKSFLKFAGLYVLILVGLQLLISLDLFMVKAILKDDVLAGYYNAAVTLGRIPYMLLMSVGFILLPSVSKLTKPGEDRDNAANFIRDAIRYLIMLIVPAVALGAATSKQLLRFFFLSDEFVPASTSLTILLVGLGALAFYLLLANIVSGAGKPQVALGITLLLLIVSAVLGNILIPMYQLTGAALQTTSAGLIGLVILATYTFKTFSIPLPTRSIINVLIASALAVAPTYFIEASRLTLIPLYILSGLIYLAALWVLQEVSSSDRARVASLHPKLSFISSFHRA